MCVKRRRVARALDDGSSCVLGDEKYMTSSAGGTAADQDSYRRHLEQAMLAAKHGHQIDTGNLMMMHNTSGSEGKEEHIYAPPMLPGQQNQGHMLMGTMPIPGKCPQKMAPNYLAQ